MDCEIRCRNTRRCCGIDGWCTCSFTYAHMLVVCNKFRGSRGQGMGPAHPIQASIKFSSQQSFTHTNTLSLCFLLFPLWSIGHPWNALFHFRFLILRQSVGLLGQGISPSLGRYLQRKHRINAKKDPCLKWDSNPRSQCSSGRRQVHALDRAQPLWSAVP
jgi:hypothetical protein